MHWLIGKLAYWHIELKRWQTHAVNFSVQIERVNIRHTRNKIEHGLYLALGCGVVCFVLFGNA